MFIVLLCLPYRFSWQSFKTLLGKPDEGHFKDERNGTQEGNVMRYAEIK